MRLVDHPRDLMWRQIRPTSGPELLGGSSSVTKWTQRVLSPVGLVGLEVQYPIQRAASARAVAGLIMDLEAGANVLRFPFRDAHEPSPSEFGRPTNAWGSLPWGNGLPWDNGLNWQVAPPTTTTAAAAAMDATEITIAITAWPWAVNGLRGTMLGFCDHFGVYMVQSYVISGATAKCRIWPRLRRAVPAVAVVTLRPVLGMALAAVDGGQYTDTLSGRSDITLSLIEVPDYVIRQYAT